MNKDGYYSTSSNGKKQKENKCPVITEQLNKVYSTST